MCNFLKNKTILLSKINQIIGLSLGDLAKRLKIPIPYNLKKKKGWIGQLFDNFFGVNLIHQSNIDFPHLGIELKTIPINRYGKPSQNTFVCSLSYINSNNFNWFQSYIRYKLSHVLWILIEEDKKIPLKERKIINSFLWKPSKKEENCIQKDWEILMDIIVFGRLEQLNSYYSKILEIKVKSFYKKNQTMSINQNGFIFKNSPIAFYLKKDFTKTIIIKNF
ncbi:MAG: MutH/Sau3AI family endonuclease [Arsenophonus sp.]|nr:MAG: MutH/Sau3AI family endonuclease [Arsenophonus sp.]